MGHGDIWEAEEAHGNPACSHQIKQWQQGGGKQSSKAGWRSKGAVPMTEGKMIQLLQHIQQQAMHSPDRSAFDRALLTRVGFAFCLAWQTGYHGISARTAIFEDFIFPGQGRGSVKA